ncbi:hypothetical protein F4776DRAFT_666520 [Hypoxylon sp. NC0597]|nr:hypothetical protein F4776DRAFT_666520 [Hypoxylon sp. NC0597]
MSLKDPITIANESISTYNLGWFQVKGMVDLSRQVVNSRFSLRDYGYVFWDVSRLTDMKWENYKRMDTYVRKTAETRLRGVEISWHHYQEIAEKYKGFGAAVESDSLYDTQHLPEPPPNPEDIQRLLDVHCRHYDNIFKAIHWRI